MNVEQLEKLHTGRGFLAALDQSGGSTPKALGLYGVREDSYHSDAEMFDAVHAMRTRIMTDPAFTGERVLGAILFEDTMDRQVNGRDTADHLWDVKGVVPILKVDRGLAAEAAGVQLMKPIDGLDGLLERAVAKRIFGTKMRSVVTLADEAGIQAVVDQQFDIGAQISAAGLVPILEPEVDITSPQKAEAEKLLRAGIVARLDALPAGTPVMLKLSLPSEDDFYAELIAHPRVVRVVALSGGYSRDEADAILARQHGMIASFSRALSEGLHADQTDAEFHVTLDAAIRAIYAASCT